ncbi:MAG: hypothetical protein GTN97_07110 [Nitrosopumilaceae archaeon]|nr:hypothetical protein [Nitrosopumilaceae archaeon]
MPIFFGDPFNQKKIVVRPTDSQLAKMIESGIEDYTIDTVGERVTLRIADTWWNRRKLKKLKINFKR